MKKKISTKHIIFLIALLSITPFILFLSKNFLQIEFFTAKYFMFAVIYSFFFVFTAIFLINFHKNFLFLVLFFAYFGFLQFYFSNMQNFLIIFKENNTGFYLLLFIFFISFIATLFSNLLVFINFVFILLSLNIAISFSNLIPITVGFLKTFYKTTNTIDKTLNTKKFKSVKYPNIFYIIPDGLASPRILKNYASIDFDDSIKKFEKKGFIVSTHNYSSYNTTHLSLASLFKMDYPVTEKSPIYKNKSQFYPAIRNKNSELLLYLKENGYKFVIAPPLWGGCPPLRVAICLQPKTNSYIGIFFQDYAIASFLHNSLIKKILYKYKLFDDNKINDSIKTTLNKMKTNPKVWTEGGVFTMIHAMMPHTPYREKDCSLKYSYKNRSVATSNRDENTKYMSQLLNYKSSVYCAFNRIHEISEYISNNYPNASIVVQSDHGIYITNYPNEIKFVELPRSFIDARLGIFTAVKGCNSEQAAKLNQANIVKYIIECIVSGKPSKQIQNKSYFGFYKDSPYFGKIFRVDQK